MQKRSLKKAAVSLVLSLSILGGSVSVAKAAYQETVLSTYKVTCTSYGLGDPYAQTYRTLRYLHDFSYTESRKDISSWNETYCGITVYQYTRNYKTW